MWNRQDPATMRTSWTWTSPHLDTPMSLARWGHAGKPFLLFPTGGADHLDVERFKLVAALAPLWESGRIKLYSVDSVCRRGWLAEIPAAEKVDWQRHYSKFVEDEVFPLIEHDAGPQSLGVGGISLGAYQAWLAGTRRPDRVDLCVGLSGTYLMERRLEGFWNEDWYFHDPRQFVPGLGGSLLAQLRQVRFVLGLGERYENPGYTDAAAETLDRAGARVDVLRWRDPAGHDWPTWRAMFPMVLNATVPQATPLVPEPPATAL